MIKSSELFDVITRSRPLTHVSSVRCWCNPVLLQPCPEIEWDAEENEVVMCDKDCWRCSGSGVVPEYFKDEPTIVLHRWL